MKKNDSLWKGILENVCDDFLRFFFKDADTLFDLRKGFGFLDKELDQLFPADDGPAPKFVDKLVRVYTRKGKEEWILVHIEIQGYEDRNFAQRLFTYFYRILDKYHRPVTTIVIFSDPNKNYYPTEYTYDFLGTKCHFQFNTYKIIDQDEKDLEKNSNPFAFVIHAVLLAIKGKKMDDESLYKSKYWLAKSLLRRQLPKKKISDLLIFLRQYVKFANKNFNVKFDTAIQTLTENKKTMGIRELVLHQAKQEGVQEGLQKGLEKAQTRVVKNLLADGRFTMPEIAGISGVTENFVRKIKRSLKK